MTTTDRRNAGRAAAMKLASRLATRFAARFATLSVALLAWSCFAAPGAQAAAGVAASLQDARLATELGLLPGAPSPALPQALSPQFAGAALTPCSGVDLHAFLAAFDPNELLVELRDSILGGAQAALSNYLLALAYSAPTLASILDMSDRTLAARHAAFSRSCAIQHADNASNSPAGRLAQAEAQCFSAQLAAGAAPTVALRRCIGKPDAATAGAAGSRPAPATLATADFLQRYADRPPGPRFSALLGLLPDARVEDGAYQSRPARIGVADLADLWSAATRQALDQVDAGASPAAIAACSVPAAGDAPGACLPDAAAALLASPSYRATALLRPDARAIFKDALAGQLAVAQVYAELLELQRRIDSIQLQPDADVPAGEWLARRRQLHQDAAALLGQADQRARLQETRAAIARMQLAALERARDDLRLQSRDIAGDSGRGNTGLQALLPFLAERR